LDLWAFSGGLRVALAVVGVLAILLVAWLLTGAWQELDDRERRALRWLIPGGLLSMLPAAAAFPMNRLLLVPSLAASVIIACLVRPFIQNAAASARSVFRPQTPDPRPKNVTRNTPRRPIYRFSCGLLAVIHLILAPLLWPCYSFFFSAMGDGMVAAYLAAPIDDAQAPHQHVFLVNADNPLTCIYPPIIRAAYGHPMPAAWHALSGAATSHKFSRTHANRFVLEAVESALTDNTFLEIVRNPSFGFRAGETIELDGCRITILDVVNGKPRSIAVECDHPLDDPTYLFLQSDHGSVRPFTLPPVGERRLIPRAPLRLVLGP
jgi:hypothetical protein